MKNENIADKILDEILELLSSEDCKKSKKSALSHCGWQPLFVPLLAKWMPSIMKEYVIKKELEQKR